MQIQLSELKANPAKYFDLARTTDVIVTKRGRRLGRIVHEDDTVKSDRENAFLSLMELVKSPASSPARA